MDQEQYLLSKLAEECNEIAQIALKCQQFGLNMVWDGVKNKDRLYSELNDLMGAIKSLNLCVDSEFSYTQNPAAIERKIDKINYYMEKSIDLGQTE